MKYKVVSVFCLGLMTTGMLRVGLPQSVSFAAEPEAVPETETYIEADTKEESKENTEAAGQGQVIMADSVFSLFPENVGKKSEVQNCTVEAVVEPQDNLPETTEETVQQEESEYADLAIANVTNYVNVRVQPDTDSEIVGKIYDGAVAQILETAGTESDWFKVISGNVEGYIKAEFFLYGEAAQEVIDDYVTRYAVVLADRLNVRENPDLGAKRIGYIDNGEKVKLLENQGDWMKVQYTSEKTGYVAAEYVTVSEEFVYAKTLEEEAAEIAARKALEARQNVSEATAAENVAITAVLPSGIYENNSELRSAIVDYAMQFLGNKYVHGGQSLQTGTDCSGFTSLIYAEFGYSVSRTPSGQLSGAGRGISYSEIQPGDIICYGSGGKCTHVALYIGDGQIIHSANSKKGVVIYSADYDNILGVKNLID